MAFETGKIMEFVDNGIQLILGDPNYETQYVLRVAPSSVGTIIIVSHGKNRYATTPAEAKRHILDAIEIASLSVYAASHTMRLDIPFYPNIIIPLSNLPAIMPVVKRALDNYF
jgi:hypothetical protein